MQTRRYEFPPPNANPRDQGGPTVPTAEQPWSDFQKRVVNGQLTEAEKRLIRRSMEHSMETDRLQSRMRTRETELAKVGVRPASSAFPDRDPEREGRGDEEHGNVAPGGAAQRRFGWWVAVGSARAEPGPMRASASKRLARRSRPARRCSGGSRLTATRSLRASMPVRSPPSSPRRSSRTST